MDSILVTVKKACFLTEDVTAFDDQIIMYTNTVLGTLTQMGVGPANGYVIEDKNDEWGDFIKGEKKKRLEMVKSYVGISVRLLFDPPTNSTLQQALEKKVAELEWRIIHVTDS